jgi:hypothetical protein
LFLPVVADLDGLHASIHVAATEIREEQEKWNESSFVKSLSAGQW